MDASVGQTPDLRLPSTSWRGEIAATLKLAWPLVVAQLAQMALFTTDVVMMGWLGPAFLGAGTLTITFFHPFLLFGVGILSAVATLVAQARGAGNAGDVRRYVRQGFWASVLIASIMVPFVWHAGAIFQLLGQGPEVSALAETYAQPASWLFFPGLAFIVARAFLATHDDTRIILVTTIFCIAVNAICNYALMFGNWGFPRLELAGAAISTVFVNSLMFGLLLLYILAKPAYRQYSLLTRFWRSDWSRLGRILQIGLPVGLMLMAEVGMFALAGLMMGWLGTTELAAHAVAFQLAGITFMVPMGLSHASTVRVGMAYGARDADGIRRAGWVSIGLGTTFMALTAMAFFFLPETLVALFLDPALEKNQAAFALAVSYLGIAAMFQLVDGAQVVSAAVLRGINDTKVPMFIGFVGYWGVGLVLAYTLGFVLEARGVGIWLGLAAALSVVAITMTTRFACRERFGLVALPSS
ncbi:MAG: MATE family efflux transporter [Rhodomicrobiaceae bacterium]